VCSFPYTFSFGHFSFVPQFPQWGFTVSSYPVSHSQLYTPKLPRARFFLQYSKPSDRLQGVKHPTKEPLVPIATRLPKSMVTEIRRIAETTDIKIQALVRGWIAVGLAAASTTVPKGKHK